MRNLVTAPTMALFLAAVALSLTACGAKGPSPTTQTPAAAQPAASQPATSQPAPATSSSSSGSSDYDYGAPATSSSSSGQAAPAQPATTPAQPAATPAQPTATPAPAPAPAPAAPGSAIALTVVMNEYSYAPKELAIPLGSKVKLTIVNEGQRSHDFVISGAFSLESQILGAGKSQVLEFTADKAGIFQIICTQRGHKDRGMVATLTVK